MRSIRSFGALPVLLLSACFSSQATPSPLGGNDQGLRANQDETPSEAADAGGTDAGDAQLRCELQAKQCYTAGGDTSSCDAMLQKCAQLAPATSAPAPDAYTSCLIDAKQCYGAGGDPSVCDAMTQKCAQLAPAPAPTAPPTVVCEEKLKACSSSGVDAKTCDSAYQQCVDALTPKQP